MKKRIICAIAVVITSAAICTDLIFMITGSGISETLDFGAGAYYYTDIPGFEQMFYQTSYVSGQEEVLLWIVFVLWGILMSLLFYMINKRC